MNSDDALCTRSEASTADVEAASDTMVVNRKTSPVGRWLANNLLLILTTVGILLGFAIGFGVRETNPSAVLLTWIGMPGELFIRILKLMVIPLVASSVVAATASLDAKSNARISVISLIFIVATNIIACVIAIILSLFMKQGSGANALVAESRETAIIETSDVFADLLRNIFPDNMIDMTFQQTLTTNEVKYETIQRNSSNSTTMDTVTTLQKSVGKTSGTNILGIITTCLLIGLSISKADEKGKPVREFFASLSDIFLRILRWLLWFTPVGILSLIAGSIAEIKEIVEIFRALGLLVGVVVTGIAVHQLILMPLIFFICTRRNPYKFFLHIGKAWMIGFATTSTAVALPEMLSACEDDQKVDSRVSRFVIPFCVTLNADGSALYITAAAIFVGNMAGVDLGFGDFLLIGILTAICAMAIPSVPSASIVTLVMVLTSLNIPAEGISLLFAVEWILDRIRTTSNVLSHTHCAVVTYDFCKKSMEQYDISTEKTIQEKHINEIESNTHHLH